MSKLRFVSLAFVLMSLAASLAASAAPFALSCSQEDPMERVFHAASRKAQLPTKCGAYCDSPGGYTTPTATAIGSSCAIAQTNLTTQLKSYATSTCGGGSCQFVVTTTVACHASGSGFSVSGYGTHGCRDSTC
jgi:hypothetical protein